jgi:Calcineurin-like phosphoesterase
VRQSGLVEDVATIAIGDIHGQYPPLDNLLGKVEPGLSAADTVVFLGDYIDRGLRSRECLDRILELAASTPATVVGLVGNHEEWLLRTLRDFSDHSWLLGMDALDTIASYSPGAATAIGAAAKEAGATLYRNQIELPYHLFFDIMPTAHLSFLENLKTYCRTAHAVCTHGGCDPNGARFEEQAARSLVWGTNDFQSKYRGAERLIYGHWHNTLCEPDGRAEPVVIGRTIGIDTIDHGVLTALRLPDGTVFQSGPTPSWILEDGG